MYACKVIERAGLSKNKEDLILCEIGNQNLVDSDYVVKIKKSIKTDSRYYIFMEFCNGGDLKELIESKD